MEDIRFTSSDDTQKITYHIDLHEENKSRTLLERVLDKHVDYKRIERGEMQIEDSYAAEPSTNRPRTSVRF